VTEHVGRDADVGRAGHEALDLFAPRSERHRAVEDRDPLGVKPVDLTREREDGSSAERDHDRSGGQRAQRPLADELERELSLEHLELALGECAIHERKRVEGA
jgi:hypothetical protein